jgi:hypothetical protein
LESLAFVLFHRDAIGQGVEHPADPGLPLCWRSDPGRLVADGNAEVQESVYGRFESRPGFFGGAAAAEEVIDEVQEIDPGLFFDEPKHLLDAGVVEPGGRAQAERKVQVAPVLLPGRREDAEFPGAGLGDSPIEEAIGQVYDKQKVPVADS